MYLVYSLNWEFMYISRCILCTLWTGNVCIYIVDIYYVLSELKPGVYSVDPSDNSSWSKILLKCSKLLKTNKILDRYGTGWPTSSCTGLNLEFLVQQSPNLINLSRVLNPPKTGSFCWKYIFALKLGDMIWDALKVGLAVYWDETIIIILKLL